MTRAGRFQRWWFNEVEVEQQSPHDLKRIHSNVQRVLTVHETNPNVFFFGFSRFVISSRNLFGLLVSCQQSAL